MARTYVIENLDNLLSDMSDALTDEQIAPLALVAGVGVSHFRTFLLEFVVGHLANACGMSINDLKDGSHMTMCSYMDVFSTSLGTLLYHYEFPTLVQMMISKFCSRFILPTMAGLISEDLQVEVLGELEIMARQIIERK